MWRMKRELLLSFALAAAAAGADTVQIAVGALDSFAAAGNSDANGYWVASAGAAAPALVATNGGRRLSFLLKSGESLEYHPTPAGNPERSTAEVAVSNVTFNVGSALPASANPDHQASITVAKPAGAESAAYYGWAGAMADGAPVWIRLAGAEPSGAEAEVDVGLSFDYREDPATVSFKVDDALLHAATNAAQTVFPLATAHRKVRHLVFTGMGSIGDLSGLVAVFDLTPPAIEPGEGLIAGDPPGVEMTDEGFVVRFRTKKSGVEYELVASADLAAPEEAWLAAAAAGASETSGAAAEADADGQLVELLAAVDKNAPAMFYKIRAKFPKP